MTSNPAPDAVSDEILPCPFCGKPPEVVPSGDGTGTIIECLTPGCVNPHVSYYGNGVAKAHWNRRASLSSPAPATEAQPKEDAIERIRSNARGFQVWGGRGREHIVEVLDIIADLFDAATSPRAETGEGVDALARRIYMAWQKDERFSKDGAPHAFYWAELAAEAAAKEGK